MKISRLLSIIAFGACLLPATFAVGEEIDLAPSPDQKSCFGFIKECLSQSGLDKANCFYSASKHSVCEGTELGGLAFTRWSIAPSLTANGSTPPALLGPTKYDDTCIAKCDNQWMSCLVDESSAASTVGQIERCYSECAQNSNLEVLRP